MNVKGFERIFVNREAEDYELAKEVISNLPEAKVQVVSHNREVIDYFKGQPDPIGQGKKAIYLARYKGMPLKKCPGTKNLLCCNYYVFSPITNCPFDCSYCIMQDYINSYAITIYVNIDEILEQIKEELQKHKDYFYRIGTGELGDSLALDKITHLSPKLVRFFSKIDNACLELKTKSVDIQQLLEIEHKNVVIAWSLNPDHIIAKDEMFAASLEERIQAACACQKAGYLLAFHFDPIFYYSGWEKDYQRVVDKLFKYISPKGIVWISLGTFRFPPSLKKKIKKRFPESRIILEEFVLGDDAKMRYVKFIRRDIYRKMVEWIQGYSKNVPVYFCMESREMWEAVFGSFPQRELETIFKRK